MSATQQQEKFEYFGDLEGHRGAITALATPSVENKEGIPDVVSASRDKSVISWKLFPRASGPLAGAPLKSLVGHSDFVQDVQVSSDGSVALTGSWDNTLALWDLRTGQRRTTFRGHTNDVLSVALSNDVRLIVSGSRDRTARLWDVRGRCRHVYDEKTCQPSPTFTPHTDWVSVVRLKPGPTNTEGLCFYSGGWDGNVNIMPFDSKPPVTLGKHDDPISALCLSPDASLCASGCRGGKTKLWELAERTMLNVIDDMPGPVNALLFSPKKYWLCIAQGSKVRIVDLESRKITVCIDPEKGIPEGVSIGKDVECTSLAWSPNGEYLFCGYADGKIRVLRQTSSSQ